MLLDQVLLPECVKYSGIRESSFHQFSLSSASFPLLLEKKINAPFLGSYSCPLSPSVSDGAASPGQGMDGDRSQGCLRVLTVWQPTPPSSHQCFSGPSLTQ